MVLLDPHISRCFEKQLGEFVDMGAPDLQFVGAVAFEPGMPDIMLCKCFVHLLCRGKTSIEVAAAEPQQLDFLVGDR